MADQTAEARLRGILARDHDSTTIEQLLTQLHAEHRATVIAELDQWDWGPCIDIDTLDVVKDRLEAGRA